MPIPFDDILAKYSRPYEEVAAEVAAYNAKQLEKVYNFGQEPKQATVSLWLENAMCGDLFVLVIDDDTGKDTILSVSISRHCKPKHSPRRKPVVISVVHIQRNSSGEVATALKNATVSSCVKASTDFFVTFGHSTFFIGFLIYDFLPFGIVENSGQKPIMMPNCLF